MQQNRDRFFGNAAGRTESIKCTEILLEMTHFIVTQPAGKPAAQIVLAHGAGAPMDTPFMNSIADGLAARGILVARF